jgi:hypothetical protein
MDRVEFGDDRTFFLERRLSRWPALCKVVIDDTGVMGYACGRRGGGLVSVGPMVVKGGGEQAAALLGSVTRAVGGRELLLGVLETNTSALECLESLGFRAAADPPWRMVLGEDIGLGQSPYCYAIGSAAKG